jgi:hypothetical protein
MASYESLKGSFCSHAAAFCQEGYCSECEIYKQSSASSVRFPRNKNGEAIKPRELVSTSK